MVEGLGVDAESGGALFHQPLAGGLGQARAPQEVAVGVAVETVPSGHDDGVVTGLELGLALGQHLRGDGLHGGAFDVPDDGRRDELLQRHLVVEGALLAHVRGSVVVRGYVLRKAVHELGAAVELAHVLHRGGVGLGAGRPGGLVVAPGMRQVDHDHVAGDGPFAGLVLGRGGVVQRRRGVRPVVVGHLVERIGVFVHVASPCLLLRFVSVLPRRLWRS